MKIFEYAIIHHGNGSGKDTILKPITAMLAETEREVLFKAAREIPKKLISKLGEIEVAIRPF